MLAAAFPAASAEIKDPLDIPAVKVGNLAARPMLAAAKAGERIVAVGSRGVVITSDDQGKSWNQSEVPVQSDLVAVHFPNPANGWTVGHDGVVLHSADGGNTWERQLDGRLALDSFRKHYRAKINAGDSHYEAALAAVEKNFASGPLLPYLDVWFKDASTGYAVGSFGLLIATHDGGRTWEPWFERIDNHEMLNLNGIRGINGQVYIAAERGIVFRLDEARGRFERLATGYSGSLFGIVGTAKVLVAYGLRGSAFRSHDGGQSWQPAAMPSEATFSAGIFVQDSNEFLLVNVAGEVITGPGDARRFELRGGKTGERFSSITALSPGKYLITSLGGVQVRTDR